MKKSWTKICARMQWNFHWNGMQFHSPFCFLVIIVVVVVVRSFASVLCDKDTQQSKHNKSIFKKQQHEEAHTIHDDDDGQTTTRHDDDKMPPFHLRVLSSMLGMYACISLQMKLFSLLLLSLLLNGWLGLF